MENYSSPGHQGATSTPNLPPLTLTPGAGGGGRARRRGTDIPGYPGSPAAPTPALGHLVLVLGNSLELVREAVVEAHPGAFRFLPETHQVLQPLGEAQKFFGAPGCQQGR